MQTFTGYQYLLIDIANNFGLDKDLFEDRIQWVESNMHQLEALADKADCKPLYLKAVMTLRSVQAGKPTGHLIGMDACCSGIQVMSALTGCVVGATHTGLVDPTVRADAYTKTTTYMNEILGGAIKVARKAIKQGVMTVFYGSKAEPKKLFGEDTPEINAFYEAIQRVAPGAWELLQDLLGSWQPFALKHSWKLPDGFDAVVKVMEKKEARIEVDELDHATFTYEFYVNEGQKKGLSLVANVVHSVDAYVLRGIHRRCNYDVDVIANAYAMCLSEINLRDQNMGGQLLSKDQGKLGYYMAQYERSGMADVVIAPFIKDGNNTMYLSYDHLKQLVAIMDSMLQHKPFPVVTVHDEFKCGGNNMNFLRQHYINIFAELAESNLLSDVLSQIHGTKCVYKKLSTNLGTLIRGSNYGLS